MSTVAKVKCYSCNNVFEIYLQERNLDAELRCPYCLKDMEEQSKSKLFSAIGVFDELNRDFRKYSSDRSENLFQFDLVTVENPIDFDFLKR